MASLILSHEARKSAGWRETEEWLRQELASLREQNDSLALTPERTASIRGKIELIKDMLNASEQQAPQFRPVAAPTPQR